MKRIYEAANSVEAHMIVHLLDRSGIEAHVQGEHLQSGVGELPLGGLVGVVVADEDAIAARRHINEWEEQTRSEPNKMSQSSAERRFPGQLAAFVIGGLLGGGVVWSMLGAPYVDCVSSTSMAQSKE